MQDRSLIPFWLIQKHCGERHTEYLKRNSSERCFLRGCRVVCKEQNCPYFKRNDRYEYSYWETVEKIRKVGDINLVGLTPIDTKTTDGKYKGDEYINEIRYFKIEDEHGFIHRIDSRKTKNKA